MIILAKGYLLSLDVYFFTLTIKAKIINDEYVMACGYTDEDGIKNIVKAYKEVTSLGVDVVIYEHDRVTTVDFLMSLMNIYSDIERDMQEMDDLMYGQD